MKTLKITEDVHYSLSKLKLDYHVPSFDEVIKILIGEHVQYKNLVKVVKKDYLQK